MLNTNFIETLCSSGGQKAQTIDGTIRSTREMGKKFYQLVAHRSFKTSKVQDSIKLEV